MAMILVVDDRPTNRDFLITLLGYRGHRLLEAADGAEALQLARAARPDLIVSDILMPEQEGLQTIRELRHEVPDVKIIAVSGGGSGGALQFLKIAKLFGAQRTLWKPFDLAEIRRALRDVLKVL